MITPIYTTEMTERQRAWFYAEYEKASKDELVGVLLALFLGGLGIHRFYMGQTGLGILYLIFFWTGVPAFVGFVECFLMPGRIREYNALQAQRIASQIMTSRPQGVSAAETEASDVCRVCSACRATAQPGAVFCAKCGAGTLAAS
jgi:TM2 domain-containing membrane protein YozV